MIDVIKQEADDYKRALAQKLNDLQITRNNAVKLEAEINMLNGAIQVCEKLLSIQSENDSRKTK
jgi:hypothetical protein